jgi:hypothetical protein
MSSYKKQAYQTVLSIINNSTSDHNIHEFAGQYTSIVPPHIIKTVPLLENGSLSEKPVAINCHASNLKIHEAKHLIEELKLAVRAAEESQKKHSTMVELLVNAERKKTDPFYRASKKLTKRILVEFDPILKNHRSKYFDDNIINNFVSSAFEQFNAFGMEDPEEIFVLLVYSSIPELVNRNYTEGPFLPDVDKPVTQWRSMLRENKSIKNWIFLLKECDVPWKKEPRSKNKYKYEDGVGIIIDNSTFKKTRN